MLERSETLFNFKDIKQSLYDLYLKQLGNQADMETQNRLCMLKQARGALLAPLKLDEKMIGSIEMYRFNGLSFDTELEGRLKVFGE